MTDADDMKLGNGDEADEANWYAQGVHDFNDGVVRVVPGIVFHYKEHVRMAKAWYRGWDSANLRDA